MNTARHAHIAALAFALAQRFRLPVIPLLILLGFALTRSGAGLDREILRPEAGHGHPLHRVREHMGQAQVIVVGRHGRTR